MKHARGTPQPLVLALTLVASSIPAYAQLGDALGGIGKALQQFDVNAVLRKARTPDRNCERPVDAPDVTESAIQLTGLVTMTQGQMARTRNVMKDKRIIDSAKSLLWVPIDYEYVYADELHKTKLAEGVAVEPDDMDSGERKRFRVAQDILSGLVAQLPGDQPYRYRLFLSTESGQNAQALPGGYIYVTASALEGGEALLGTLLAHEISHVSKRHYSRRLQARMVDMVSNGEDLVALLRGDRNVLQRVGQQVQQREKQGVRFSIDQELEADACAVRLVSSYPDIDAGASVSAFLGMLQQEGAAAAAAEGAACEAFGDCHPNYRERERTMRSMIGRSARLSSTRDAGTPTDRQRAGGVPPATEASNRESRPGRGDSPLPGVTEGLRSLERMFLPRR